MTKAEARKFLKMKRIGEVHAAAKKALQFSEKARNVRRAAREGKAQKHAAKMLSRAEVRAACLARSREYCENCGALCAPFGPLEMDHFFGRHIETVESCWMLCGSCHKDKTNNNPSAAVWNARWRSHCVRHGYVYRGRIEHQPSAGAAGQEIQGNE